MFRIISILMVITCCGESHTPVVSSGSILSRLALPTPNGPFFSSNILENQPFLLTFWSPSCEYCSTNLPVATKVASKTSLPVVTISVRSNAKPDSDGIVLLDLDGSVTASLGVHSVPTYIAVDANGIPSGALTGEQTPQSLNQLIETATTQK